MNKTGTRSVAAGMRLLGFRTLHKGDHATSALVDRAANEGLPLLTYVGERWDAYFDVYSLVTSNRCLDVQYPQSRFILTTRGIDGWLDSREKHVRANQERAARGDYQGTWLTIDRKAWIDEWQQHHDAVRTYFTGRSQLVELDVASGEGWDVLCPFLGVPSPANSFPWENKQGAGTYAGSSLHSRATGFGRAAVGRLRRFSGER